MEISFSADNQHFHGVVYLLMITEPMLCKGEKKTEKASNVVLTILLEIKFKIAVRLVDILDMQAEKKKQDTTSTRRFSICLAS